MQCCTAVKGEKAETSFQEQGADCFDLVSTLNRSPNIFFAPLLGHVHISRAQTAVFGLQEQEETDELLLMDEEMLDAPPEDLPRRLLTSFAVYNAEVGSAELPSTTKSPDVT